MKKITIRTLRGQAIILVIMLLGWSTIGTAQTTDKPWNIGLHGGIGQYYGDLGHNLYQFNTTVYGFGGISASRQLGRYLDLNIFLTKGEIGFSNSSGNFRSEYTTGTINLRFNMLASDTKIRPYLFAGLGVLMFTDFVTTKSADIDYVAPSFGAGLNISLTPTVMLNLQETFLYSTEDKRDGVINKSNDLFLLHSVGLTFNFGRKHDADNDGVKDRKDRCANTPPNIEVDEFGCPFDEDKDGVYNYLDECENTASGITVNANGCPMDTDGDGVPDYLDKCSNTSSKVMVDANGCPIDTDQDGVADYLDNCPNTPEKVEVDANGCALDFDGDGIPDYKDKCNNTAPNATVDMFGCTLDTDRDGIPDYLDKCPTLAGVLENEGCPVLTKEVEKLFEKALQGIKFETGKSTIKQVSAPILNAVVKVMNENPSYKLIVAGHTDNVGGESMNMTLSKNRADAVANYLIGKGVSPARISTEGYGFSKPVDDNTTAAGRTRNRRVELSVEYIEMIEVEK